MNNNLHHWFDVLPNWLATGLYRPGKLRGDSYVK
jgi:hypothetical protein